jgi:hypothetical protein
MPAAPGRARTDRRRPTRHLPARSATSRDGGQGVGVLRSIGPKTSLVDVYRGGTRRIRNELLHPQAGPNILADREADTDVARRVFRGMRVQAFRNSGTDPRSVPRARSGLFRRTGRNRSGRDPAALVRGTRSTGRGFGPAESAEQVAAAVTVCDPSSGTADQGVVDSRACRPATERLAACPNPAAAMHDLPPATRTAWPGPVSIAHDGRCIWPASARMVRPALAFNSRARHPPSTPDPHCTGRPDGEQASAAPSRSARCG